MSRPQLSIDSLPAWAHLNEVSFFDVHVASTDGSGLGLVALRELATTEQTFDIPALLRIPHYVVLNAAAVEEYAKQDRDFRLLIDAAGHQVNINPLSFIKADLIISADLLYKSSRGDILIFLLVHLILGTQPDATAAGLPGPWTEYIKFLPDQVPLPTVWTEDERLLLQGTSLEHAVQAKLLILEQEFDRLRETSSDIPCWQARLWDTRAAQLKDWRLVDAWYRSRCLELPLSGEAMVPCLDMANHSSTPNAYYEEKSQGEVTLLLRPSQSVRSGDEITISYGEQKSAAEMLFSYGFIDRDSVSRSLVLPLDPFDDDPLAKAKTHLFGEKPTVRVAIVGGDLRWESPFAYLMCVNEEDGLAFRVLQDTDGNRQLKLFWQHEDVTNSARSFDKLTKAHRLSALFELRVVTVVEELLGSQLARLQVQGAAPLSSVDPDASQGATGSIREECHRQAALLRELEAGILSRALEELEEQKSQLLADDNVVAYLGSMEATESGLAPEGASNEDDDFS